MQMCVYRQKKIHSAPVLRPREFFNDFLPLFYFFDLLLKNAKFPGRSAENLGVACLVWINWKLKKCARGGRN
jgi:hypothetical protein